MKRKIIVATLGIIITAATVLAVGSLISDFNPLYNEPLCLYGMIPEQDEDTPAKTNSNSRNSSRNLNSKTKLPIEIKKAADKKETSKPSEVYNPERDIEIDMYGVIVPRDDDDDQSIDNYDPYKDIVVTDYGIAIFPDDEVNIEYDPLSDIQIAEYGSME